MKAILYTTYFLLAGSVAMAKNTSPGELSPFSARQEQNIAAVRGGLHKAVVESCWRRNPSKDAYESCIRDFGLTPIQFPYGTRFPRISESSATEARPFADLSGASSEELHPRDNQEIQVSEAKPTSNKAFGTR